MLCKQPMIMEMVAVMIQKSKAVLLVEHNEYKHGSNHSHGPKNSPGPSAKMSEANSEAHALRGYSTDACELLLKEIVGMYTSS